MKILPGILIATGALFTLLPASAEIRLAELFQKPQAVNQAHAPVREE
jgi:hypothetical protein